jgi:hypothetical protein
MKVRIISVVIALCFVAVFSQQANSAGGLHWKWPAPVIGPCVMRVFHTHSPPQKIVIKSTGVV